MNHISRIIICLLLLSILACSSESSKLSPSIKEITAHLQKGLDDEPLKLGKLKVIKQESKDEYNRSVVTHFETKLTLTEHYYKVVDRYLNVPIIKKSSSKGESAIIYGSIHSNKNKDGNWEHYHSYENVYELLGKKETFLARFEKSGYALSNSKRAKDLHEKHLVKVEEKKKFNENVHRLWITGQTLKGYCYECEYRNFKIKTETDDSDNLTLTWISENGEEVKTIETSDLTLSEKELKTAFWELKDNGRMGKMWLMEFDQYSNSYKGKIGKRKRFEIQIDESLFTSK